MVQNKIKRAYVVAWNDGGEEWHVAHSFPTPEEAEDAARRLNGIYKLGQSNFKAVVFEHVITEVLKRWNP